MIALAAFAVPLLALGAALLVLALGTVALAPVLASRAAAAASKPQLEKLGRRASGDDRMRALISAQRSERSRAHGLSGTLTRTGWVLGFLSIVSLLAGIAGIALGSS
ncbi:MAG TPA: hypothetical protein VFN74_08220 [Chloroflexota bacterium]|jgi:hypothetical protein|nr:hypothetical protein [Chloroflexota bacterium]